MVVLVLHSTCGFFSLICEGGYGFAENCVTVDVIENGDCKYRGKG